MFGLARRQEQLSVSNNDKIALFDKIASKVKTQNMSVVKKYFDGQNDVAAFYGSGHPLSIEGDKTVIQSTVLKGQRILNYRTIANYAEVGDAIDEIADSHITSHDDGKFAKAVITNGDLTDAAKQQINKQAEHYLGLFNFEENGFEYAKRLTIEAELAWENIVSDAEDEKDLGVVDIRFLPAETYEFAYDVKLKEKTGIVVFGNVNASNPDVQETKTGQGGVGANSVINTSTLNYSSQIASGKVVYLPFEQITYINSGIYDKSGLVVYPPLERARRAYNQLQLVEDAILIYRLVRAPSRSVFTVDCGKMSPTKASQMVRQMSKSFTAKKMYDPATGSIVGNYDPFSIMENIWIPKTSDSGGVQVSTFGGEAKWGDLDDLNYFLRKLYRALKVPSSRFINDATTESKKEVQYSDSITYDEYRFAKYVVRSLTCFGRGLKEGLINHLKLTGLWEANKLKPQDIKISICPPIEFEIFRKQKLVEMKVTMYERITKIEGMSSDLALAKYMGMNESEIKENQKRWRSEQIRNALLKHRIAKIEKTGKLVDLDKIDKEIKKSEDDFDEPPAFSEPEFEPEIGGNEFEPETNDQLGEPSTNDDADMVVFPND